ncbi:MAG: mannosyltransferase [Candidatus Peregrinibacteria bacterium GW2011_GWA2_43_8]|nr:MAG: mannosyltransferase [Candidatus Peregrinibacteria bacterium GW2011_GWA2_43_8]
MKIGIDARLYGPSFTGIGRYVKELIDNLLKVDDKNEYILFMNSPGYESFETKGKNVKKILVDARHYSFTEQFKFLRAIKKEKVDVMHFTHFNAPIFYKKPFVVTIHDLTLHFYPGKKMTSFYRRLAYKLVIKAVTTHAKRIIAVSENTKNDLVRLLKINPEKVSVIYEGVDKSFKPATEDAKKEICKKYGILKPFMLYTGVWRSHKNLVNLIKAFGYMKKKEGFDGQLVITGKDDPTYVEIKANIKDLGLEADTVFTGMVDDADLPTLYGAARVYVFPSLYEGFGLPPLESMACGTPVAVSKAACLPEVCGEKNAMFFDPYDPTDMGEAVLRVWSNEELRQNLTDNGLKRSAEFSWDYGLWIYTIERVIAKGRE